MSLYVWYVGPGRSYNITGPMWGEKGISGVEDVSWNEYNSWSIDQSRLTTPQLNLLAGMKDFSLGHSDLQPRPVRPAAPATEAAYNKVARNYYEKTKAAADIVAGIAASTATALGVGSVELGHASDTTLSRSAAGVLAVEGVAVPTVSSTDDLSNKNVLTALNAQTASYTLVLADKGKAVEVTSASATNVTVPPNSSVDYPIGTVIEVAQLGTGQVTLVAGEGVTLQTPSSLLTRAQFSSLSLRKRATDTWLVTGDMQ